MRIETWNLKEGDVIEIFFVEQGEILERSKTVITENIPFEVAGNLYVNCLNPYSNWGGLAAFNDRHNVWIVC